MREYIRIEHCPVSTFKHLVISRCACVHVDRRDERNIIDLLKYYENHGISQLVVPHVIARIRPKGTAVIANIFASSSICPSENCEALGWGSSKGRRRPN